MYYRCAIVCFLGAVLACGCGRRDKEISPLLSAIMNDSVSMAYDRPGDSVPDDGCVRLRTRTKLPLSKLFNDINPQHIEVARRDGIIPVDSPDKAWTQGRGLVKIESNRYYFVDELTHSYPYLKPHAAALLAEIGRLSTTLCRRGVAVTTGRRLRVCFALRSQWVGSGESTATPLRRAHINMQLLSI